MQALLAVVAVLAGILLGFWIRSISAKRELALLDQRNLWKEYLRDYKVPAADLLKDGVH